MCVIILVLAVSGLINHPHTRSYYKTQFVLKTSSIFLVIKTNLGWNWAEKYGRNNPSLSVVSFVWSEGFSLSSSIVGCRLSRKHEHQPADAQWWWWCPSRQLRDAGVKQTGTETRNGEPKEEVLLIFVLKRLKVGFQTQEEQLAGSVLTQTFNLCGSMRPVWLWREVTAPQPGVTKGTFPASWFTQRFVSAPYRRINEWPHLLKLVLLPETGSEQIGEDVSVDSLPGLEIIVIKPSTQKTSLSSKMILNTQTRSHSHMTFDPAGQEKHLI